MHVDPLNHPQAVRRERSWRGVKDVRKMPVERGGMRSPGPRREDTRDSRAYSIAAPAKGTGGPGLGRSKPREPSVLTCAPSCGTRWSWPPACRSRGRTTRTPEIRTVASFPRLAACGTLGWDHPVAPEGGDEHLPKCEVSVCPARANPSHEEVVEGHLPLTKY